MTSSSSWFFTLFWNAWYISTHIPPLGNCSNAIKVGGEGGGGNGMECVWAAVGSKNRLPRNSHPRLTPRVHHRMGLSAKLSENGE